MTLETSDATRRSFLKTGMLAAVAAAGPASAQAPAARGRTYVLVHGAWFGGWAWKTVAEGLRAAGHTVYAPTMTGVGERKHLARAGINLDTHTDDIVNVIEMEDLSHVVLVGWSYGGMVVGNVLARVTPRIASMVYLDAFVPERGKSLVNYANRTGTPEGLIQSIADNRDLPLFPLKGMGIENQAIVDYCMPRLGTHPVGTFLQASKALSERPNIPHTYILASGYANPTFRPFHKQFSEDRRWETFELNTSHATMLTDPAGTIELLKKVK